jgi:hypothetical protein
VHDARDIGCGRCFTAVLTWSGEVFVWGKFGNRRVTLPKYVEQLRGAFVTSIAAGQGHLVMVTGELEAREQVQEQGDVEREEAGERLKVVIAAQMEKAAQAKQEKAEALRERRAGAKAEKRRVQFISRLAKQRARLKPKVKKVLEEEGAALEEGAEGGGS